MIRSAAIAHVSQLALDTLLMQLESGRYGPRIASLEFAPGGKQLLFCAERAVGIHESPAAASRD